MNNLSQGQLNMYYMLAEEDIEAAQRYLQILHVNQTHKASSFAPEANYICAYKPCSKAFYSQEKGRKYCCKKCDSKARTKTYERLLKVKK